MTIDESFAYCKRAASHYENFPVASLLFPLHLRKYCFAVYAFSRGADDIADEANTPPAQRLKRLDEWESLLCAAERGTPDHPVFLALAESIRRCAIPPEPFHKLISAFRQDVTVKRHETFADVLDYCKRSANPVGEIVLALFGMRTPETLRYSNAICTALQLTNFWQDIASDLARGRIYIPLEDLRRFGVAESDIAGGCSTSGFRELMAFETARTEEFFNEGMNLLPLLHGRLRAEIRWIALDGSSALRKIVANDFDVIRKNLRLTPFEHARNLLHALLFHRAANPMS